MPDGSSLFVSSWQKALSTEHSGHFVLTDPFSGLWYTPQIFELWCEAVEGGLIPDISLEDTCLAIVHDGPHFSLCTSKCKQSDHNILHPVSSVPDNL